MRRALAFALIPTALLLLAPAGIPRSDIAMREAGAAEKPQAVVDRENREALLAQLRDHAPWAVLALLLAGGAVLAWRGRRS